MKMLTGQAYEIDGVGFAGGKGFVGPRRCLGCDGCRVLGNPCIISRNPG